MRDLSIDLSICFCISQKLSIENMNRRRSMRDWCVIRRMFSKERLFAKDREKKSNERDRDRERKSIEARRKANKIHLRRRFFVPFVLFDYSNLIVRVELTKSIKETQ